MTPEGKVKKEIKDFLDSLGSDCWYFMPMMVGFGRKGIPDIIGCYKNRLFAFEVKAEGKRENTTPWQDVELAAIRRAHGIGEAVDSVSGVRKIFERYLL